MLPWMIFFILVYLMFSLSSLQVISSIPTPAWCRNPWAMWAE